MKSYLVVFWLVVAIPIYSHIYLQNCALRIGVANIDLLSTSPLTSYYQPSVFNSGFSCSISQPFQLGDVENGNISFSHSINQANLSVGSNYIISEYYKQYANYITFNYNISNVLTIGITPKLVTVAEESFYSEFISDLGFMIHQDKVRLAVSYTNLFQNDSDRIDLPNITNTEISYSPTEYTRLGISLVKEKGHNFVSKLGIRQKMMESLSLMSGYILDQNQVSFGICFHYFPVNVAYAVKTHQVLKSTHYISLSYEM